jgi:hypothetical protein
MMFLAQMGIGALANMVAGAAIRSEYAQKDQMLQQQFTHNLEESTKAGQAQLNDPFGAGMQMPTFELADNAPEFPHQAAAKLQQQQTQNAAQRQELTTQIKDQFADLRQGFFDEHHLEFPGDAEQNAEAPPDERLASNTHGQPTVAAGKETPTQQAQREDYETKKQQALESTHQDQRDNFAKDQQQNLQTFLQNNKPDLGNPAVQGELQKAILTSHKKALQLTKEQDAEKLHLGCYTPEQHEFVDKKLAELGDMEARHAQEEDNSPEAQQLLAHQQALGEFLQRKQEELRSGQLVDNSVWPQPVRYNLSNQAVDLGDVLPPHLAHALYQMGIYTV